MTRHSSGEKKSTIFQEKYGRLHLRNHPAARRKLDDPKADFPMLLHSNVVQNQTKTSIDVLRDTVIDNHWKN